MRLDNELEAIELELGQPIEIPVVGCWIRGLRGEPGFWSRPVFELYGLKPSENVPPIEVVLKQLDAREQAVMWRSVERCAQGDEPFAWDYTIRTPSGKTRLLRSSGQLSRSSTGEQVIIGTLQDLSGIHSLRSDLQRLAKSLRNPSTQTLRDDGLSASQWDRIQKIFDQCGTSRISVPEMANRLGLGLGEFSRRFRVTTGETPHQYLLRFRLERASQALRLRERSIASVAADFGFFDQSHFTRHFKRRYGLSPARFAQVMRGGKSET